MEFGIEIDLTRKKPAAAAHVPDDTGGPDTPLWRGIRDLVLDQPSASMPFSARLARDHLWTQVYADKVISEYRRFLYLLATETDMVTPSEDVDEAWHLHLSYTKSYWDEMCGKVVGRALHHDPTEGIEQAADFRAAYARTLELYRSVFRTEPPSDVWPTSAERFDIGGGFRTVPLRDFRLIGRLSAFPGSERIRYVLPVAAIVFVILHMMAVEAPGGAWFAGWVALVFLSAPIMHFLGDLSLPRWGATGIGFAKYQSEPDKSGGGGCGGCGGCG